MSVQPANTQGIEIEVADLIELRARLNTLGSTRNRRQASTRSGARELHLRGRGMEYAESRAYVYGDDIRTMDWRVMARTGEAHSKVFAEEKDHSCLLAVDLSPSMFFGTRLAFKSWAAAQLAAHAGWLADFSGERVGGLGASSSYHFEVRPGKTRHGLLNVFQQLALAGRYRPDERDKAGRLGFLLKELRRVVRPGSRITLISDFLQVDETALQALSSIARHNDIVAYRVHDDCETGEWPAGHYPLTVGDNRTSLDLTVLSNRNWLNDLQAEQRARIESLFSNFAIELRSISCNHDITTQFLETLN